MRKIEDIKPPRLSGDRVQIVKSFLEEHYEIKINAFDQDKSYIRCRDDKRYTTSPTFNDISLHMESIGIRGCDSILKKIISSPNQVTIFNPIIDWADSLANKWKGESHIDKFCSYIHVREFPDQEEGFYQERFKRLFRKWLVASLACVKGEQPNDAALGFIHAEEGIGKSSLIEFLVPKALKNYYQKSDKDPRYFDLTKAFTQNFIVNFDDNVALTKPNAEPVKAALSSMKFTINNFFSSELARMANVVLTSNKTSEMGGFLLPELGTRRWALIELDRIDHGYSKHVDIDQLWAEAWVLYKNSDFNFVWDMNDFNEFAEYNMRYMVETNAKRLIREYYRKPLPDDQEITVWKQPLEILQDLRNARKLTSSMNNVSEVTVGFALKALGFEKKAIRKESHGPRYGYYVVPLY